MLSRNGSTESKREDSACLGTRVKLSLQNSWRASVRH